MSVSVSPYTILALAPFGPVPASGYKPRLTGADIYTLDEALAEIGPRFWVELPRDVCPQGGLDIAVTSLAGFRPENLVKNTPYLADLEACRTFLAQARSANAAPQAVAADVKRQWPGLELDLSLPQAAPAQESANADALDDILSMVATEASPAGGAPGGAAATASDWVRHLAWQVADTSLGRGVRSIERHIKARAGQPLRRLLRLQRAEALFFEAREEFLAGRVVWSEVAARGGYSDQAHLCRETREITGHSPHELARVLKSDDESYWIYRIWL